MKNAFKSLALAALMTVGLNAYAGAGLAIGSIANLAQGSFLASALGGGLGAASILHGVRLVQNGKMGWGVFFLILQEKEVITSTDVEVLDGADVATKEAFLEIISSEISAKEKEVQLAALFN
jgi:hypothetical protein